MMQKYFLPPGIASHFIQEISFTWMKEWWPLVYKSAYEAGRHERWQGDSLVCALRQTFQWFMIVCTAITWQAGMQEACGEVTANLKSVQASSLRCQTYALTVEDGPGRRWKNGDKKGSGPAA